MLVSGVSSASVVCSAVMPFFTEKQQETVKKNIQTSGYSPVTANIWGEKTSSAVSSSMNIGNYIAPLTANRPTNNPDDIESIEADTQHNFRLRNLKSPICCPDCGNPIMTKPIFSGVKRELARANEKTYLNVIENHSEFLFPLEKKIFDFLKEQKELYPNKSLTKIVHSERQKRIGQIEKQQYQILDSIGKYSESLPDADRTMVKSLLLKSGENIFEGDYDIEQQKTDFLESISKMHIKDNAVKSQLYKLAASLPDSRSSESAWFVKYGGYDSKTGELRSSEDIAIKLLTPAYTNTDHVHPWNRGGLDTVSNFWLMHARCNIIKTDKPFNTWLNEDRENRISYIKQYLTDAQNAIDKSKDSKMHPKYDLYSAKLAKTIYYETNGEVDFTEDFPLPEGYDVPVSVEEE